jgi:hypothetical protein
MGGPGYKDIALTENIKLNWLDTYKGWIVMIRLNKDIGSFFFPTGPVHPTPERAVKYIHDRTSDAGFDGLKRWTQTVRFN